MFYGRLLRIPEPPGFALGKIVPPAGASPSAVRRNASADGRTPHTLMKKFGNVPRLGASATGRRGTIRPSRRGTGAGFGEGAGLNATAVGPGLREGLELLDHLRHAVAMGEHETRVGGEMRGVLGDFFGYGQQALGLAQELFGFTL